MSVVWRILCKGRCPLGQVARHQTAWWLSSHNLASTHTRTEGQQSKVEGRSTAQGKPREQRDGGEFRTTVAECDKRKATTHNFDVLENGSQTERSEIEIVPTGHGQMAEAYKNPDFGRAPTFAQRGVNACPPTLRAYLQLMRLDRPIGSWLLFWPCGWSLALAAPPGCLPDPTLLALFGLGALVMRGAGCTINDMWDRNIDKQVSRTSSRPLADGTLSLMDATALLAAQLGLGCFILLQLNFPSVLLGASSLGLVVVYPLMKRVTWFPQLVLGFTFNWGALLGWTATTSTLAPPAFLLYGAGVAWTLIYDTIYAHQDKEDDAQLGIKSTALKFGESTQPWLAVIGTGMVGSLASMGVAANLAWPYYLSLVPLAGHIIRQIWTLDINDPADCGRKFRSNRHVGLLLFLGIVSGTVLKPSQELEKVGERDPRQRGEVEREERGKE